MTEASFEAFKKESQESYAKHLAETEEISLREATKNTLEQFNELVPQGLKTPAQLFFDVLLTETDQTIGFVWLDFRERFDLKVTSINDILIHQAYRGKGYGKKLMSLVEQEAKKAGAVRIRLHVFNNNTPAKKLYESMGFEPISIYMKKDI